MCSSQRSFLPALCTTWQLCAVLNTGSTLHGSTESDVLMHARKPSSSLSDNDRIYRHLWVKAQGTAASGRTETRERECSRKGTGAYSSERVGSVSCRSISISRRKLQHLISGGWPALGYLRFWPLFPCVSGNFYVQECSFPWEIPNVCFGSLLMKKCPLSLTGHKTCDKTAGFCSFIHTDAQHRLMTHAVQHSHI